MVLTQLVSEANLFSATLNQVPAYANRVAAYHGSSEAGILEAFQQGVIRVLVVCGKLLEGFDQPSVSVAAIVRNVQPSSRVLFAQFVGRAVRRAQGEPANAFPAVVLSHIKHNQQANFDNMDMLAEEDPEED